MIYIKGRKTLLTIGSVAVLIAVIFSGLRPLWQQENFEQIPVAPDYADSAQWMVVDRQGVADLFYIVSTETGDYQLLDGTICHYADTHVDSLRQPIEAEMTGVEHLLSGELNFFAPYYRQCSLQSFENDSLGKARLLLPFVYVKKSFDYYIAHLNNGRPFVLMGFSQGAMLLVKLLREMDNDTFSHMIAAYAIGMAFNDSVHHPHIVPAHGADDMGVTVCYNSVREIEAALPGWNYSKFGINPVNWQTDTTTAVLITEPTPLKHLAEQKKNTMSVRLDPATNLLLVEGYTATDYVLPLIGKEGNYHSREIWLYRDQLRENIALRTKRFLE